MHAVHPGDGVADHLRAEHYVLTRVFSVQWWLTPPMKARTLWLPAWQSEILRVVPGAARDADHVAGATCLGRVLNRLLKTTDP